MDMIPYLFPVIGYKVTNRDAFYGLRLTVGNDTSFAMFSPFPGLPVCFLHIEIAILIIQVWWSTLKPFSSVICSSSLCYI